MKNQNNQTRTLEFVNKGKLIGEVTISQDEYRFLVDTAKAQGISLANLTANMIRAEAKRKGFVDELKEEARRQGIPIPMKMKPQAKNMAHRLAKLAPAR